VKGKYSLAQKQMRKPDKNYVVFLTFLYLNEIFVFLLLECLPNRRTLLNGIMPLAQRSPEKKCHLGLRLKEWEKRMKDLGIVAFSCPLRLFTAAAFSLSSALAG